MTLLGSAAGKAQAGSKKWSYKVRAPAGHSGGHGGRGEWRQLKGQKDRNEVKDRGGV